MTPDDRTWIKAILDDHLSRINRLAGIVDTIVSNAAIDHRKTITAITSARQANPSGQRWVTPDGEVPGAIWALSADGKEMLHLTPPEYALTINWGAGDPVPALSDDGLRTLCGALGISSPLPSDAASGKF